MSATPRLAIIGEGHYVLNVPDLRIGLDADRVVRDRFGGLRCELTVRCDLPEASTIDGDVLWSGDLAFADTRGKADLVQQLEKRLKKQGLHWALLIDELGMRVRDQERVGEPAIILRDAALPALDEELPVDGLTLLRRHPTILFGDGAAGKSYLALYLAGRLDQSGLKVGLFDWELDEREHRRRLERLFGPKMPGVIYARCSKPLVHEIDRLAGFVQSYGIDFAVFDSIAFACDGPPEDAVVANEYLRAVRSLRIGSLNLAHVTKSSDAGQKPFGSTFWHNGARMTWFAKLAAGKPGDSEISLSLVNRKSNLGPRLPNVEFRIRFDTNKTTFSRVAVPRIPGRLTTIGRVTAVLTVGPMTVRDLADELGVKKATVQRAVNRAVERGELVQLAAGVGIPIRFALPERQEAA